MDYETPDGSQISLRAVWTDQDGQQMFAYTSVSAYVHGSAYVGKLPQPPDEIDDADVLTCLEPVPHRSIHPKAPDGLTIAPDFNPVKHYLKAPSFTYEDCRAGRTFIADCVLNEVNVLERLRAHPHPNLVSYLGCIVRGTRISHICFCKYPSNLVSCAEEGLDYRRRQQIYQGILAGIKHLHGLGLAHNDINPENICLDDRGEAIIIDFDGCLPFGQKLRKGISMVTDHDDGTKLSSSDNDLVRGLDEIRLFLDAHSIEEPEIYHEETWQT